MAGLLRGVQQLVRRAPRPRAVADAGRLLRDMGRELQLGPAEGSETWAPLLTELRRRLVESCRAALGWAQVAAQVESEPMADPELHRQLRSAALVHDWGGLVRAMLRGAPEELQWGELRVRRVRTTLLAAVRTPEELRQFTGSLRGAKADDVRRVTDSLAGLLQAEHVRQSATVGQRRAVAAEARAVAKGAAAEGGGGRWCLRLDKLPFLLGNIRGAGIVDARSDTRHQARVRTEDGGDEAEVARATEGTAGLRWMPDEPLQDILDRAQAEQAAFFGLSEVHWTKDGAASLSARQRNGHVVDCIRRAGWEVLQAQATSPADKAAGVLFA